MTSILDYNEKKVTQKAAELIHASGYLKDTDRLTLHDKSERFQRLNTLNQRTKANMLHISLNFDLSENIPKDQLAAIADRYMEGIGFKDQPYLVYQHTDADHPHIHIVTNIIQADGARIPLNNIGKQKSEPTRKAIEKEFHLVTPEDRTLQKKQQQTIPVDLQKIVHGNTRQIKQAMRDVLQMVNQHFQFTTLPEYNAILRQYNITAEAGGKDSQTYKHKGLVYQVLDEKGNKVGIPIKASAFYFKPTLANLEKKFELNQGARQQHLSRLRHKIDWILQQGPATLREFITDLQKEGIELVIRQIQPSQQTQKTQQTPKIKQPQQTQQTQQIQRSQQVQQFQQIQQVQQILQMQQTQQTQQTQQIQDPQQSQQVQESQQIQQAQPIRQTQQTQQTRQTQQLQDPQQSQQTPQMQETQQTKQNDTAPINDLIYVDNQLKTAVHSSALGNEYSASNMLKKFDQKVHSKSMHQGQNILPEPPGFSTKFPQLLSTLLQHDEQFGRSPGEFQEEQEIRKRKRR